MDKIDTQISSPWKHFFASKIVLRVIVCWGRFHVFDSLHPSFHRTIFFGAPLAFLRGVAIGLCRRCVIFMSLCHRIFLSSTALHTWAGTWCIGTYIVPTYTFPSCLVPCNYDTLLPCYLVTSLPCYSVTLIPCYSVALLLCYSVTLLPYYRVTLLPCYPVTLLPCYPVTLLSCYSVTLLLCSLVTLLLCYLVTLLLCYLVTLLLVSLFPWDRANILHLNDVVILKNHFPL